MKIPAHDYPPIDVNLIRRGDVILWEKFDDFSFSVKQYVAQHDRDCWLLDGQHFLVEFAEDSVSTVSRAAVAELRNEVEATVDELLGTPLWAAAQKVVDSENLGKAEK